jgi:hypothetical protein
VSAAGATAGFLSTSLPFQLKVIEGRLASAQLQNGQPPGILQLAGRALPFRPIQFGGTQRVQTVWYPGNPKASQLVIGPTEKPTTVNGEWNDKYLGDGQAFALAQLLDSIRLAGVSVEVTWPMTGLSGSPAAPVLSGDPEVRTGLITDFTYGYLYGREDITWTAEFTWRSKGQQPTTPPISSTGTLNPREGFNDVALDLALTQAMTQSLLEGPVFSQYGLPQALLNKFDQDFAAIDSAVDSVQTATAAVTSATIIPAAAAQQLIASAQAGVQACINMVDNILAVNLLAAEVQDSAMDILRLLDPMFDAIFQADTSSETCIDAANGVAANMTPDIIAVVTAPAGTDLRDLALRYYGSADSWFLIAEANDIAGSAVPASPTGPSDQPNRPIVIPRLQAGTSANISAQC